MSRAAQAGLCLLTSRKLAGDERLNMAPRYEPKALCLGARLARSWCTTRASPSHVQSQGLRTGDNQGSNEIGISPETTEDGEILRITGNKRAQSKIGRVKREIRTIPLGVRAAGASLLSELRAAVYRSRAAEVPCTHRHAARTAHAPAMERGGGDQVSHSVPHTRSGRRGVWRRRCDQTARLVAIAATVAVAAAAVAPP